MVMVLIVLLLGLLLGVWLLMLVGLTFPLLVLLMLSVFGASGNVFYVLLMI